MQLYSKRGSDTSILLWILWNFQEHLFCRTHPGDCCWQIRRLSSKHQYESSMIKNIRKRTSCKKELFTGVSQKIFFLSFSRTSFLQNTWLYLLCSLSRCGCLIDLKFTDSYSINFVCFIDWNFWLVLCCYNRMIRLDGNSLGYDWLN